MSQRAIDRFRPQPASKPQPRAQSSSQAHPTKPVTSEDAGNFPVEPAPLNSDNTTETSNPLVHVVPVDLEPAPATAQVTSKESETPEEVPSEDPTLVRDAIATPQKPVRPKLISHTKGQLIKSAQVIGVPLIWIGIAAFCGGTGYAALNWLLTIPPAPECDRLWLLSPDADKLFCAEQAARSGQPESLQAGLKVVKDWALNRNHQLYPKASRLYQDWSKQLLQIASRKALDSDLNGAIQVAEAIKPENPAYRQAKNFILDWQKLRDRDQLLSSTVEAALKAQDWKKAEVELQPPSNQISAYQRQQINRLRERVVAERVSFNQLQQVRDLVNNESATNAETLGRAIQLATQINPASYVGEAARQEIQRWTQSLIRMAETHLQGGDVPGAIAAARWLPADASVTPQVQDLLWVSRAQQPTPTIIPQILSPTSLWQQTTILAALQQIQPTSPLHPTAQANRSRLEQQVQDLTQLSFAKTVASVPQIPAIQVGIQIAQSIALDRPHRILAQTLIADWRKDIERIQDRPYLVQARKLATSNQIKDLQAAIAEASKIPLGRALRPEAQAAIFDWQQQIQKIEDQPTLDKAQQLAKQKQFPGAIQEASKISAGRALYPEAQQLIHTWVATIQTAEDRPILDEAKTLAAQGNWGTAIDVAYQIAPGRALYDEAQTAIAQWTAQLPKTRRSRFSDDSRSDDRRNDWERRGRRE